MEEDWDIFAVVKPYITSSSTIATSSTPSSYGFETSTSSNFFSLYPAQQSCHIGHGGPQPLKMLNFNTKPFFLQPQPISPSPKSSQIQSNQYHFTKSSYNVVSTTPKFKRRNIQPKKKCEVQAQNLSSDLWAWKKYGQKHIKGSPYPRGYFKCSSLRECLAKKQVEQKKSDPTKFIITYFGEHNHPAPNRTRKNYSFAGSQKSLSPQRAEEENATHLDDFFKGLGKLTGLDDILKDLDESTDLYNCCGDEGQP